MSSKGHPFPLLKGWGHETMQPWWLFTRVLGITGSSYLPTPSLHLLLSGRKSNFQVKLDYSKQFFRSSLMSPKVLMHRQSYRTTREKRRCNHGRERLSRKITQKIFRVFKFPNSALNVRRKRMSGFTVTPYQVIPTWQPCLHRLLLTGTLTCRFSGSSLTGCCRNKAMRRKQRAGTFVCLGRKDCRTRKPGKWQASRLISLTVDLPPALLPTLNPRRKRGKKSQKGSQCHKDKESTILWLWHTCPVLTQAQPAWDRRLTPFLVQVHDTTCWTEAICPRRHRFSERAGTGPQMLLTVNKHIQDKSNCQRALMSPLMFPKELSETEQFVLKKKKKSHPPTSQPSVICGIRLRSK